MRKYAKYDADGHLTNIGVGLGGVEITDAEYTRLREEITRKASYVSACYAGRIAIDAVPEEYRAEVVRRVADRQADQQDSEATTEDYQAALAEMGVDLDVD